jgi:hypothetical protein
MTHLWKLPSMAATQNICAVDNNFQCLVPLLELAGIHYYSLQLTFREYSTAIAVIFIVSRFSLWQETSLVQLKAISPHCGRCWICPWGLAISGCTAGRSWGNILLCRCSHFRPVGSHCVPLCWQVGIQGNPLTSSVSLFIPFIFMLIQLVL